MNCYASVEEVKDQLNIESTNSDTVLHSLLISSSRLIDSITGRKYFPTKKEKILNSLGNSFIYLDEGILEISTIEISSDNGDTYETLETTDYFLGGFEFNKPHESLSLNPNGQQGTFYPGFRAIKITGIFGYHDDYTNAWIDTGSQLLADVDDSTQTWSFESDVNGDSLYSIGIGDLLKINDEYVYPLSLDTATDSNTVLREVNGTTKQSHTSGDTIYKWVPISIVKQATIIQAVRTWKRAETAFQDTTANQNTGRLAFTKKIDPEVETMLYNSRLYRMSVG